MMGEKVIDIVAVLHSIRSVHNVGSIFRTADAAGVRKVYLCGITPTPLDRFGKPRKDFIKVSLGAEKSVAWEKISERQIPKLFNDLKKEHYKILAIEQAKNSVPYQNIRVCETLKLAVVMGNEVRGLPPSVLKEAEKVLEIPMRGKKESLNVAVAFGIVAFGLLYN